MVDQNGFNSDGPNKIKLSPLNINADKSEGWPQNRLYTPRAVMKEPMQTLKVSPLSPFNEQLSSTKSMIFDLTYMGERKRKASRNSEINNPQTKMISDYIVLKN